MGDPAPVRDSATCFRAGRVVARTFAVWSRTLPQLLLISALVHVPVVALMFWLRRMDEFSLPRTLLVRTLPSLEATAVTKCCEGFAVLLVFRRLRGERPDLVRSLREGLRRLVTIAVVATLLAVAFLVPTLVVWLRI